VLRIVAIPVPKHDESSGGRSAIFKSHLPTSGGNEALRGKLFQALTGGGTGPVAFIAAYLVAHFKIGAAEAGLPSALTIKLLANPAVEEVCETWSSVLSQHGPKNESFIRCIEIGS
jgi:hypothetical protein